MFSSSKIEELNQFLKTQVSKKNCPGFDQHAVFLTHQGHVYTRGLNSNGQLGLGDTETRYRHRGHLMPIRVPGLKNIIDIETGTHHTLCLNNKGHVYAFGNNTSGQLGLGDDKDKTSPCLIESLKDCVIVSMKTNACVSYFLDTEGNFYSCGGFNNSASLGLGKDQPNKLTLPKKIPNLPAIKEIIPCGDHVFFLTFTGDVYSCGNNNDGQLGVGDNASRYEPTKLNLPPVKQIVQKSLIYVFYHAPLFKVAKDSILEKECLTRVDNMDNDWCLKNSLIFKNGIDLDSASYVKTVSQHANKKKIPGAVPSLKFLSALSFINQRKRITKSPEIQENMTEDMKITESFKRLEIKK